MPAAAAPASRPCGWHPVDTPNPIMQGDNSLLAVDIVSWDDAWAVGSIFDGEHQPLAQHWDGRKWSVVPTPTPPESSGAAFLLDVDISGTSDGWAVGSYTTFDGTAVTTHGLVERWNGVDWTIQEFPDPLNMNVDLASVVALSPEDVWAAGASFDPSYETGRPFTAHFDGASWSVITVLDRAGWISDVTAVAGDDVWAVGAAGQNSSNSMPLVLHWDGSEWAMQRTPDVSEPALLSGITAVDGDDIWAAGWSEADAGRLAEPLVEHWDGRKWRVSETPHPSAYGVLSGISAASATDVWAVGFFIKDQREQVLVEHWDGQEWSVARADEPESAINAGLQDVSTLPDGRSWAVGLSYKPNGMRRTLAMRKDCPGL
ncbi:MAG: hypothetical protein H0W27_03920 [Actinobacteria bacterium]|nr:hypothetical protein [Actinomycetota bacterium]